MPLAYKFFPLHHKENDLLTKNRHHRHQGVPQSSLWEKNFTDVNNETSLDNLVAAGGAFAPTGGNCTLTGCGAAVTGGNCVPTGCRAATAEGSLTVEASLVFPLFLFAIVAFLFFFRVFETMMITEGALASSASLVSVEAEREEEPFALALVTFYGGLEKNGFSDETVLGGKLGISFAGSDLSGEYIDLHIQYYCKLPIRIFSLSDIPVSQRIRMKKWTGFSEDTGDEDALEYVYITLDGEVYHRTSSCSYLNISVKMMNCEDALKKGYTPCQICGYRSGTYLYYFVTEDGKRYHKKIDCRSLKRTVSRVTIQEAGDRRACSRCGREK